MIKAFVGARERPSNGWRLGGRGGSSSRSEFATPENCGLGLSLSYHQIKGKLAASHSKIGLSVACREASIRLFRVALSRRRYGSVGAESPVIRSLTLVDSSASSITKNKPPRPFWLLLQFPLIAPC